MPTKQNANSSPAKRILFACASLVVPGLRQFIVNQRWRGLLILLTAILLGSLIYWSAITPKIALVSIGGVQVSWLWLALALFWAWNMIDAYALGGGKSSSIIPGVLFAALILYVIAWNVAEVKTDRLIARFGDARTVALNL